MLQTCSQVSACSTTMQRGELCPVCFKSIHAGHSAHPAATVARRTVAIKIVASKEFLAEPLQCLSQSLPANSCSASIQGI